MHTLVRSFLAHSTTLSLALVLCATSPLAQEPTSDSSGGSTKTMASLPLDAQYAISAAMGRTEKEYHAKRVGNGLEVANSAQGLTASFSAHGVDVRAHGVRFGLALQALGRGDVLDLVAAASPSATENRIEYRRGILTEWYVNGPQGLQQGFTVAHRPANSALGALTLALSVRGGLEPVVDGDGRGLTLEGPDGTAVLRYAGLTAFDAEGTSLPARLVRDGARLLVRVEDADARYPVIVDPFVQKARLLPSDGGGGFGVAVAISGNTVVVGANAAARSQGKAYVFEKPATGWVNMTEVAQLTAAVLGFQPAFLGTSVAVSGDTVVVGANGDSFFLGAAFVYVKPAAGWTNMTETAKLTAFAPTGINPRLGESVGISGDTVVAGAPGVNLGGGEFTGAAYVFEKPATGWVDMTETARLTASDGMANHQFGTAASISGDTVVVGATRFTPLAGAAYLFERPVGGWTAMTETAQLTASDGAAFDQYGSAAANSSDTVVVGAYRHNNGRGAVYLFEEPTAGWANMTETAKLTASDAGTELGKSVAISGERVFGTARPAGAYLAYIFEKPATGWVNMTETSGLPMPPVVQGVSVAISGTTAVLGANGLAYVFEGPSVCAAVPNSGCGLGALSCTGSAAIGSTLSLAVNTCGVGSGQAILLGVPLPTPWSFPSSFACGGTSPCLVSCLPLLVLPGPTLDISIPFDTSMIGGSFCLQGGCAALSGCFAFTDRADVTVTN